MLKYLGYAALVLVAAIAIVLAYAATRPDTFRVARSLAIAAPPDRIFPLIDGLHNWRSWSPYEEKDPDMKRGFEGPDRGKGAIYTWDGDGNVGSGRMTITDSVAPSRVAIDLEMMRPISARNEVVFTIAPRGPEGDLTSDVTWAMSGRVPYFAKIIHMFINMDRMVGGDFEKGLATLKAEAEKKTSASRTE